MANILRTKGQFLVFLNISLPSLKLKKHLLTVTQCVFFTIPSNMLLYKICIAFLHTLFFGYKNFVIKKNQLRVIANRCIFLEGLAKQCCSSSMYLAHLVLLLLFTTQTANVSTNVHSNTLVWLTFLILTPVIPAVNMFSWDLFRKCFAHK